MSWWERLLDRLGLRDRSPAEHGRVFEAEQSLIKDLQILAEQEQRPVDQVAIELLQQALERRRAAEVSLQIWQSISPREQQVAALVCLDYTNRQIAARLGISQETVKTHVRNLLAKFGLRTKVELRQFLADWDFSEWDRSIKP
jgi:DNA-binding CsgD family transcriptional regulator